MSKVSFYIAVHKVFQLEAKSNENTEENARKKSAYFKLSKPGSNVIVLSFS